ncbi:MAG: response regulator transcription factor [Chromatiaceae bacterium]|jgi:DNA-binding NarL/FixJ family response regulator|nr:response regulator transcription factor [Chromatiaceae bacterium]
MPGSTSKGASCGIGVLLAEDHAIFRQGLRALLEADGQIRILGEASNGHDAIHLAAQTAPDLVIIDLSLPGTNGTEAIPKIKQRVEGVKIIALTAHNAEEYVRATLAAGATGYVLKEDSHQDLMSAIHSVMAGKVYLSPGICRNVVSGFLGAPAERGETPITVSWDALSLREREILKLTAEGKTNREMSDYLHISVKTVEKHRAQVMRKLGAKRIADLTAFAIRQGLLAR